MENTQRINETIQNLTDTTNLKEPKKVPVLCDITGWAFHYAGVRYDCIIDNPMAISDNYMKIYEDMPLDMVLMTGFFASAPIKAQNALGMYNYALSDDGNTITHNQSATEFLGSDVYDKIIEDTDTFMNDTVYKHIFPSFRKPKEEALKDLKEAYYHQKVIGEAAMTIKQRQAELGLYGLQDESLLSYYAPFNFFFDLYRGIVNSMSDIRRYPKKVKEACDIIFDSQSWMLDIDEEEMKKPFPVIGTIYHSECFMSPKQYDEYYWHYLEKGYRKIIDAGKKLFLFGEGSFINTVDRFNDLPKGSSIILLDTDDPFKVNEILGGNQTLMCGIKTDMLQMNTVSECADFVRKSFDELAPGGGFIFSTNQTLLSGKDGKVENVLETFKLANELSRG